MNPPPFNGHSSDPEGVGKRLLLAWLSGRGWEPDGFFEGVQLVRRGNQKGVRPSGGTPRSGEEKRFWSTALASELTRDIDGGRRPDDLIELIEGKQAEQPATVRERLGKRRFRFISVSRWIGRTRP